MLHVTGTRSTISALRLGYLLKRLKGEADEERQQAHRSISPGKSHVYEGFREGWVVMCWCFFKWFMLEGIWSFVIEVRDQNMNCKKKLWKVFMGFVFTAVKLGKVLVRNPAIIHPYLKKKYPQKWLPCHFRISMLQVFNQLSTTSIMWCLEKHPHSFQVAWKIKKWPPFHSTGIGARRSVESQGAWFFH